MAKLTEVVFYSLPIISSPLYIKRKKTPQRESQACATKRTLAFNRKIAGLI